MVFDHILLLRTLEGRTTLTISSGNASAAVSWWWRTFFGGACDSPVEALAQIARVPADYALAVQVLSPSIKTALVIIVLDPPPPGRGLFQRPQGAAVELFQAGRRSVVLALFMLVYAFQEASRQIVVVVYGGRELLEHGDGSLLELLQRTGVQVRLAPLRRIELLVDACQVLVEDLGRGMCLEAQLETAQVRAVIFRHSVHRVVHNLHDLLQFRLGTGVKVSPTTALLGGAVKVLA